MVDRFWHFRRGYWVSGHARHARHARLICMYCVDGGAYELFVFAFVLVVYFTPVISTRFVYMLFWLSLSSGSIGFWLSMYTIASDSFFRAYFWSCVSTSTFPAVLGAIWLIYWLVWLLDVRLVWTCHAPPSISRLLSWVGLAVTHNRINFRPLLLHGLVSVCAVSVAVVLSKSESNVSRGIPLGKSWFHWVRSASPTPNYIVTPFCVKIVF